MEEKCIKEKFSKPLKRGIVQLLNAMNYIIVNMKNVNILVLKEESAHRGEYNRKNNIGKGRYRKTDNREV